MNFPVHKHMTEEQIAAVLRRCGRSAEYIKNYIRGWRQVK